MHPIFLIFLLFSILHSTPAPSSLELLTADFEVLARITNAISLQAGFIQKTIPPREAILEMMEIIPEKYEEMTGIDIQEAIRRLKYLKESLMKSSPKSSYKALDDYMGDVLAIEEEVLDARNWTQEAEEMYSQLQGNLTQLKSNPQDLFGKCQGLDTGILQIIRYNRDQSLPAPDKLQIYRNFIGNISSLETCVEALSDYGTQLGNMPILNLPLEKLFSDYLELSEALGKLNGIRDQISKDVQATSAIWSANFTGDYGDRMTKAVLAHGTNAELAERPHPTYTAAFRGDLEKVNEDLGSRWFSKYFLKGADLKNLKKGLQGFWDMAKGFGEVEKIWRPMFSEAAENNEYPKLRNASFILFYIEKYSNIYEHPEIPPTKCQLTTDSGDILQKYQDQESGPKEVVRGLMSLSFHVKEGYVMKNTTKYHWCLDKAWDAVRKYSYQNEQHVDWLVERMRDKFWGCSEMELDTFLEHFETLREKQERVVKALEAMVTVGGGISVGEVIQKIGAEKTIQCLRSENFEISKMIEILDVLSMLEYFKVENFDFTLGYLERINQIKKAVLNLEKVIEDHRSMPNNPVLRLSNSKLHAENLAMCVWALKTLINVRKNRQKLLAVGQNFGREITEPMEKVGVIGDYLEPFVYVDQLVKQADEIEKRAKELVGSDVETMTRIFVDVANLISSEHYSDDPDFDKDMIAKWQTLVDNDLDFSYYSTPLKRGPSAVVAIEDYFDRIFGRKADGNTKTVVVREGSWLSVILISIGFILLVFILILVIYGFTKNGREKYEDWYIFYFGKPHHFEKRWRYSAFTDVEDGKNALHDALREINDVNLKKQLRKGAYIKAYNKFGNTALHVATKAGHPELVEMLIRHGADRRLLNVKNRTPEQCIPSEIAPEDVENYRRIEEIYRKYQKKQFRIRVPPRFPPSSFHIFVDETVDVFPGTKNQPDSEALCQAQGATLSGLQNTAEINWIVSSALSVIVPEQTGSVWIGTRRRPDCIGSGQTAQCTKTNTFVWTDNSATGIDGMIFQEGEPNNGPNGSQNCAVLSIAHTPTYNSYSTFWTGQMDDRECEAIGTAPVVTPALARANRAYVCGKKARK
uniref:C-type lectin domain-containing protein n=1 Tax=Caenorhabditis tropicalis TaxID=1561998 RepID=A0A1I7UKN1_9PELO